MQNAKNFILTFGKDFTFIRNQYHPDAFGEDQCIGSFLLQSGIKLPCCCRIKERKAAPLDF